MVAEFHAPGVSTQPPGSGLRLAMLPNQTPAFDASDNQTNCCPRFKPGPWQDQELEFDNKLFVKASTVSAFHMPLNMGSVFARTIAAIEAAHAAGGGLLVLSHDDSPWHAEHLFAVDKEVPGAEMVRLSGDFLTQVFEGPYKEAPAWAAKMAAHVKERGKHLDTLYFFYTTCPKCARYYGKNYVVGVAKVSPLAA
jgi:hypothetical protein